MKQRYIKWPVVWSILAGFAGIAVIATAGWLVTNWIQSRIDSAVEHKLSDPFILRQIAAQSRPMIVFDSKESILADFGGAQFIKGITVTLDDKDPELPRAIEIDFTTHLPAAPLLTPLQSDIVNIRAERGKAFAWRFKLDYDMTRNPVDEHRKYRLELLR